MNTTPDKIPSPISSLNMLKPMVVIGFLCAFFIAFTFEETADRIEKNKAEALEKAIFKVVPGITKKQSFGFGENGIFKINEDKEKTDKLVYAGYDENGALVGVAIEASGIGFADIIRVLYGYDLEAQKIIGFYVLESKETPGLGDKIEKDQIFLDNFKGLDVTLDDDLKSLNNKVVTVKHGAKKNGWEIDGITGATISSRAIGEIISKSTADWIPMLYSNKSSFQNQKN